MAAFKATTITVGIAISSTSKIIEITVTKIGYQLITYIIHEFELDAIN